MSGIRVVHYGLGPIGAAVAAHIARRPGFVPVGAIDIDAGITGRDLGQVAGLGRRTGVVVESNAADVLARLRPDVVVHCTSSSLARVAPQLEAIVRAKSSVVSTTEELAYPYRTDARVAERLDRLARTHGVAVLGTGVNPGFAMDALPIAVTAVCARVDRIVVERVQDARIRRLPFQLKIGAGLTRREFEARVKAGTVRHVGFTQSIAMIGDALGWSFDRIAEDIRPRIAARRIVGDRLTVERGRVSGLVQHAVGYRRGRPLVTLHLEAYLGAPETYDAVHVEGSPGLALRFEGGIHGDVATASIVVNSIPTVLAAAPGLHTMRDLPLPSFFPGPRATRRVARR